MRRQVLLCALTMLVAASVTLLAQAFPSEQIQVGPPLRHTQAPLASATPQELEQRGDELRGKKSYLDALDYYGVALKKQPTVLPCLTRSALHNCNCNASTRRAKASSVRSRTIVSTPTHITTWA